MWRSLFFCLLLINPSEYGLFAAAYYGYEMISACKVPNITQSNDVHYIAIIDHSIGTFHLSLSIFQQVYCGLNDARNEKTGVNIFVWHIDAVLGQCIPFETNDTMNNLLGAFIHSFFTAPSKTHATLCKKLEVAKKCSSSIQHNQKVEIAIPLLLHETLGNCDIENVFGFKDQKTSIFWTDDYYQPRNLPPLSANVEFVFFGAAQDFLPQEQWIPNEEMVNVVKHGKSNMVKTLYHRFQQMIGIKKKNIGEDIKSTTATTTFAPSKPATAKILNAGFNILPFLQPKPTKVQQLTTIPAPVEIHENFNQSVIGDTLPLVVRGKHLELGKRLDRYHPSESPKDNSSETETNETYSSSQSDKLTTLPPTEPKESGGFIEAFGESIGEPKYGAWYFSAIIIAIFGVILLFLFLMWCCCIRQSSKGKYEVWKKENQPLPAEPDPEAGIAYPRGSDASAEQPLLKASVSRSSTKAETENHPKVAALPKSTSSEANDEMSSASFPSQRWPAIFNPKDAAYDELTPGPAQAPSQPPQLRTDSTQASTSSSVASVYMEPALHNSAYAYQ
uniref:Uncharacterized protein n=1 Tax=Panagrolaimus sp. PS1159 TaxID=55785 RepID=A0AC35EY58_9BILA